MSERRSTGSRLARAPSSQRTVCARDLPVLSRILPLTKESRLS